MNGVVVSSGRDLATEAGTVTAYINNVNTNAPNGVYTFSLKAGDMTSNTITVFVNN